MFGNLAQAQELLRHRVGKSDEATRTQFDADVITYKYSYKVVVNYGQKR